MIRAVSIVPAILTNNKQDFREQIEKINAFTRRVQIDIADATLTNNSTIDITDVWWPNGWIVDLHLMTKKPSGYIDTILKLHPNLVFLHAEAEEDLLPIFETLKQNEIKTGVALLQPTFPGTAKQYIEAADAALIFAGRLGMQGSTADMIQTEKVPIIRSIKPDIEIGWDGGANLSNIRALAHSDLDVINVGSALSMAENPSEAYEQMVAEIDKSGVVL